MNISALARATGTTPDALRYYEKLGLLEPPSRAANGYRRYVQSHVERVRFIRSAQSLGFSLAEIAAVMPQLANGRLGRTEIEQGLRAKIAQIGSHIKALQGLKRDLQATFKLLTCERQAPVCAASATRPSFKGSTQTVSSPGQAIPATGSRLRARTGGHR